MRARIASGISREYTLQAYAEWKIIVPVGRRADYITGAPSKRWSSTQDHTIKLVSALCLQPYVCTSLTSHSSFLAAIFVPTPSKTLMAALTRARRDTPLPSIQLLSLNDTYSAGDDECR